jgi:MFS family permease
MMGFTALLTQTIAGDIIDKTTFDRRKFLSMAALMTAFSASAILFVKEGNGDHAVMYTTKIIEGVSSSFIGPCVAALTLASFGPDTFDEVMASNILWGHVGSIASAVLAGLTAWITYPNIRYCFLVIGFSALLAVVGVKLLPEGDVLMGRGLKGTTSEKVAVHSSGDGNEYVNMEVEGSATWSSTQGNISSPKCLSNGAAAEENAISSYWEIFSDRKTVILCFTGFFFHFANANVLLVLGELMGGDNEDGSTKRSAIPLIAGAIVLAQFTMSGATYAGDKMTKGGWGRKPLFMAGLLTLPLRCFLIIIWKDAGEAWLLSTQILDGIGGGFFGLLHPYLVADITFGTGRFNVIMGLTASCFGLGGTLSNLLGQIVVEKYGHVASLTGSLFLSVIPIVLFSLAMPETAGSRGKNAKSETVQVEVVGVSA